MLHKRSATAGLVLALVALTGCGSETKTVTETVEAGEGSSETTVESTSSSSGEVGKLGDTQNLTAGEVDLDATLTDLENPADTDTPPASIGSPGDSWVRVTATLVNKGSKPLDTFDATFELVDSKGQRIFGNDVTPVGPAPQISGTLLPNDKQTGAVVFLVPNGAKPEEVRLTLLSASDTPARWSLD